MGSATNNLPLVRISLGSFRGRAFGLLGRNHGVVYTARDCRVGFVRCVTSLG
jgi:hypothetical protein